MDNKNKAIVIGKNKDSYVMPLNLIQLATYLEYFGMNAQRDLKDIYSKIDLDPSSRNKYGNTIDFKSSAKDRMNLQRINKALTMELFTSSMFGYIDNPTEVHANCLVTQSRSQKSNEGGGCIVVPSNFAQGGVPDAQIDYGDFMVILEVSAKYQPSIEDYKKQLNGALKHARSILDDAYKKPIYAILINERSLVHTENKKAMEEVLKNIKPSEKISITSMSTDEFAYLGQRMGKDFDDEISKVDSDGLHDILKATTEKGVNGRFHESLVNYLDDKKSLSNGLHIW